MGEREKLQIAKEYVDKQLNTMKKYGSSPKRLSRLEYDAMVKRVASAVISK
jgi:hypothetical protein